MTLGFTGTRRGMTTQQQAQLAWLLQVLHGGTRTYEVFHHGAAIGADSEAALLAKRYGWQIVEHPAGDMPLRRNRDIVRACDLLIAAPLENTEQQRGGTWYTVRVARQFRKPVIMLSR